MYCVRLRVRLQKWTEKSELSYLVKITSLYILAILKKLV